MNIAKEGDTSGMTITRRGVLGGAAALAAGVLSGCGRKLPKGVIITNTHLCKRITDIYEIIFINSSSIVAEDRDRSKIIKIKGNDGDYVFAVREKNITVSRLSDTINPQTQQRIKRELDFSYNISKEGNTCLLETNPDTEIKTIIQHIGNIEKVIGKNFL